MMNDGKFTPGRYQHARATGAIPGPKEAADKSKDKAQERQKEATEHIASRAKSEAKEVHIKKEPSEHGGHKFTVSHSGGTSEHDSMDSAVAAAHDALGEPSPMASEPKQEPNSNALGLQEEQPEQ